MRCLLFAIHPLAAFLPMQTWAPAMTLPSATYLELPPQACIPLSGLEVAAKQTPEAIGMPVEVEQIVVMPVEAEQIDVMPVEEESELRYEFLQPQSDYIRFLNVPCIPLTEIQVEFKGPVAGSRVFGFNFEVGGSAKIPVNPEPRDVPPPRRIGGVGVLLGDKLLVTPADFAPYLVTPEVVDPQQAAPAARTTPVPVVAAVDNCAAHADLALPCKGCTQVVLKLIVAEVDHDSARSIGLAGPRDDKRGMTTVLDDDRVISQIADLRDKKLARALAEPTLVTLDGQQASFLVGGQCPVPTPDGQGITFMPSGIQLVCTPHVTDKDKLVIHIDATLSRCEQSEGVTDYRAQTISTNVAMRTGQTFAVGALRDGKSEVVLLVTPTILPPPASETGSVPGLMEEWFAATVKAMCDSLQSCAGGLLNAYPSNQQRRVMHLMNQSEGLRQVENEMEHFWMVDQPSHLTPERVHGGIGNNEESVHDLLVKCQRELSRGHYAAAEDLAQQALTRDAKQVAADPLVCKLHLLNKVKEIAVLPLGTVEPCGAKPEGGRTVSPGEGKAIGSKECMVEALMEEFNTLYKEGKYREAEALAARARELDPENASAAAAGAVARTQAGIQVRQGGAPHALPGVEEFSRSTPVKSKNKTEKEREIERALLKPVSMSFEDVPLSKAMAELSTKHGINIVLDARAVAEEGVNPECLLTIKLDSVSLKSSLGLVLDQVNLTYVIEDDAVKITTKEYSRKHTKRASREYWVGDLVEGKAATDRVTNLLDLIQNTIARKSWTAQSGLGTIEFDPKGATLVVYQTADIHEQLDDLLGTLRRLAERDPQFDRKRAEALVRFHSDFKAARYEEARIAALQALAMVPGDPVATAGLLQACEALARQPRPEQPAQCTNVGTGLRPMLRPVDPAVVNALQKILIDREKGGPAGGTEEAEPKDEPGKPMPR